MPTSHGLPRPFLGHEQRPDLALRPEKDHNGAPPPGKNRWSRSGSTSAAHPFPASSEMGAAPTTRAVPSCRRNLRRAPSQIMGARGMHRVDE